MKISNLRKSYGDFSLDVQSLEICHNKINGLIGPNGCGKSTLMKIIAGVIKQDSGGIDYEGLGPQDITMIPRKPYLLHDTVYSNLVYPLKLRKMKLPQEEIDYWLEFTGLSDRRREYAPGLSGGEQQKLALARALIFSPRLILLDECLTNMDFESIAQFEELIRKIQSERPATWLSVSHQLSHVERLCEYLYFMDKGKICAEGDTGTLLSAPANETLARFLSFEAIKLKEGGG